MKTVILCGGRGTRLGEHGRSVPKALIQIGGKPIIWHLMSIFSRFGVNDFVLCLGYLGDEIRSYFHGSGNGWKVEGADTGQDTNTGGRLNRVKEHLSGEEIFCVTYGDGLADVDIGKLVEFHRSHGKHVADIQQVVDLRNFLERAGVKKDGTIAALEHAPSQQGITETEQHQHDHDQPCNSQGSFSAKCGRLVQI